MNARVHKLTHTDILEAAEALAERIAPNEAVFPVPRGGVPVAYAISQFVPITIVGSPHHAGVIVDDLIDSGATRERYKELNPDADFMALVEKEPGDGWIVFPWENDPTTPGGDQSATDIPVRLLQYIGEDPNREGLVETPQRFLKAWKDWTRGYEQQPADILKSFADGAHNYDEVVAVTNIPAWSMCEHHLAPIFGVAHVAYIPDGKIVGLSKLNRLVDLFGRRLQVQERWTTQVADALWEVLEPKGAACIIEARHLCMESRGVCHQGTVTRTSALRGAFRDKPEARAELLRLVGR